MMPQTHGMESQAEEEPYITVRMRLTDVGDFYLAIVLVVLAAILLVVAALRISILFAVAASAPILLFSILMFRPVDDGYLIDRVFFLIETIRILGAGGFTPYEGGLDYDIHGVDAWVSMI